jgi:AcrR family transcriptional regulator
MRRLPRQQRSRELVNRLVDATAAVIVERGLDGTTTNHIAERAGVSVGSLYQYFPDKEALLEALLERLGRDLGMKFRAWAEQFDISRHPLRDVARTGVTAGLYMIRNDALMRELLRNWNRVPSDRVLDQLEQVFLVIAQPYFLKNYRDYPVENLEARLYVLVNAAIFTTIRYLLQDPAPIPEKAYVRAMTDMIVAQLDAPHPALSPAGRG